MKTKLRSLLFGLVVAAALLAGSGHPAFADGSVVCKNYLTGLFADKLVFQQGATLSTNASLEQICEKIAVTDNAFMEAYIKNGLPAVHVVRTDASPEYDVTLTPDAGGKVKWTPPAGFTFDYMIRLVFDFGTGNRFESEDFYCIKVAKDLGAKTITLTGGAASFGAEEGKQIGIVICNTLEGLAEVSLLSFMYDTPNNLCDLDYDGTDDITLGWNAAKNSYVISKVSASSIAGDKVVKLTAAAIDYLKGNGYDYYNTLNFRFAKPAAASGSTTTKPAAGSAVKKTKKDNPVRVKAKTVTVKYNKLKKKKQVILRKKAVVLSKAKGKVTYKLAAVNKKKFKKYFAVNAKNGNITIRKGLKKGIYKLTIKVRAAGNTSYKAATKTLKCTIRVVK